MQLQKLLEAVVPEKVSTLNISDSTQKHVIIVHPTSTTEVSHILHALHPLLEQNQVFIVVQNARQSSLADGFNRTHCVTIDLRRLKGISLNGDKSSVTIGAAETWTSVQEELVKHDLQVGGGNTNHSSGRKILTICQAVYPFTLPVKSLRPTPFSSTNLHFRQAMLFVPMSQKTQKYGQRLGPERTASVLSLHTPYELLRP